MFLSSCRAIGIVCAVACLASPAWSWPIWFPGWNRHYEERNLKTVSSIYNLTVYPNQVPIIAGGAAGVPPGLFAQDVVGRVDPVGDFIGFQDSIEYFFALAPLPQGNPAKAAITRYQVTHFSSACKDVAASVVYLFCSVVNPGCPDHGKELTPLKQVSLEIIL